MGSWWRCSATMTLFELIPEASIFFRDLPQALADFFILDNPPVPPSALWVSRGHPPSRRLRSRPVAIHDGGDRRAHLSRHEPRREKQVFFAGRIQSQHLP